MNEITIFQDNAELTDLLTRFVDAMERGKKAIIEAGELVAQMIDMDYRVRDVLTERFGVTPRALWTLERIGRGMMLPELMETKYRELPIDQQKKIAQGDVEVLIVNKDGSSDTLRVDLRTAERKVVRQVFTGKSIRTLAQQRQYLIEQHAPTTETPERPVWTSKGNKVVVRRAVELTKADLLDMMKAIN